MFAAQVESVSVVRAEEVTTPSAQWQRDETQLLTPVEQRQMPTYLARPVRWELAAGLVMNGRLHVADNRKMMFKSTCYLGLAWAATGNGQLILYSRPPPKHLPGGMF